MIPVLAAALLVAAALCAGLWIKLRRAEMALADRAKADSALAEPGSVELLKQGLPAPRAEAAEASAGDLRPVLENEAAKALATVMLRAAPQAAAERLTARVDLPAEDIKAKLIGREGRNIRAFENTTLTDLIIDETPGAVTIGAFDPFRREAARITLVKLLEDGRIHPGLIEDLHQETLAELDDHLTRLAQEEAAAAGVAGLAPPVLALLGKLRLRHSLGQNVWEHSLECARIARLAGAELGLACGETAARAALLHDIGKAITDRGDLPHALAGMAFLEPYEASKDVLNAVGAHHRDIEPASLEAHLVMFADALSASRPGARVYGREELMVRLEEMEAAALGFAGVEKAYAVQAGRELRVLVNPRAVQDQDLRRLAQEIAASLSRQVEYPGGIKVTVLRETRASEFTP